MADQLKHKLEELARQSLGKVSTDERLAQHNSCQIGGTADLFIEPETVTQVAEVVKYAQDETIPLVVIGQGTNLLFDDQGVRGIVMKIGEQMAGIQISGTTIVAGGGAWIPRLARMSMQAGLCGLEHCIGIPGTLGGLVIMNGGSQRRGIGENIRRVTIVERTGVIRTMPRAECRFAYRQSALQGSGCVVVEAELECLSGDQKQIRREMLADLSVRRIKFPRKQPNCGSVFLSTDEMHATVGPPGKVIEDAGLKGLRIGQAEVSRQHANFIVNLGGARSEEILALISTIRKAVQDKIGFELCCEVRYVSPAGVILPAHLKAG